MCSTKKAAIFGSFSNFCSNYSMLLKSTNSNPSPPNGPNLAWRDGSSEEPQAAIERPQKFPFAKITFMKFKTKLINQFIIFKQF